MPLYEYQCDACGPRFEVIKKYSDPPLKICPKCGGAVHKLQSAPAIQFKGSGWYITDYARKDSGSRGSEPKSGSSGEESKSAANETKSDAKTETKTEAAPAASDTKPTKTATKAD